MPTAEGWSTSKSFGMGRNIVCYGSIASFRIQEQNKHSACQLSDVFFSCFVRQDSKAVIITSSSATIIMNSKSELFQAPIAKFMLSSGLELEQGEKASQRGSARGCVGGRGKAGSRGRGDRLTRGTSGSKEQEALSYSSLCLKWTDY